MDNKTRDFILFLIETQLSMEEVIEILQLDISDILEAFEDRIDFEYFREKLYIIPTETEDQVQ